MADSEHIRVNAFVEKQIDRLAGDIENITDADVMAVMGAIYPGLDDAVRQAIEGRRKRRSKLAIVLDTSGGIIEVVERMVKTIRHHYGEVSMIVPGRAMSAGTVFAMSADHILMDYFSCLGPIDPQIERNGKLVPALSYLVQFERLKERSARGELTTAEMVLLQQLDLAELHSFEEAKELSNSLLKEWLTQYKFKNWTVTETHKKTVTAQMRIDRALEVSSKLMDHQRWHSHGRPISMEVLRRDLNLRIEDFGADPAWSRPIRDYYQFLGDYTRKIDLFSFVHTDGICVKLR
ncbi:MAG TPA: serine dehydrogenasease [Pseudomonadota bacterium]|nr:serine dehydrogenasease [Pseudomonadota bacterium]